MSIKSSVIEKNLIKHFIFVVGKWFKSAYKRNFKPLFNKLDLNWNILYLFCDITFSGDDGKVEDWSIIELQGDLAVNNNEGLTNKFLADLHYNKDVNIYS